MIPTASPARRGATGRAETDGTSFLTRWSLDPFGDEPVAARVDVAAYVERQHAAIACHRSQFPAESWWLTLPATARRLALGTLRLTHVAPRPVAGALEHELLPAHLAGTIRDRLSLLSA